MNGVSDGLFVWTTPLRNASKQGFGVDTDTGFTHRVEISKMALTFARTQSEAKQKVDATQATHGELAVRLSADWLGLIDQLKAKFGTYLHDQLLSSQSY